MEQVDNIRNSLIDKLLAIRNKDFLKALDKIVTSSADDSLVVLNDEQKSMLQMSENDIVLKKFISLDDLDQQDMEWLKKK
jgi:hypothetical protein